MSRTIGFASSACFIVASRWSRCYWTSDQQTAEPTEPYIFVKKNSNQIIYNTKKAFTLFKSLFPGIKKITLKEKYVLTALDV